MAWIYLTIAILGEIIGTLSLAASEGFSRPVFGALAVAGYLVAFTALALTLKTIPVGVAYAIWAGVGVAATAVFGYILFGQKLDLAAVIGLTMIVGGVVVIHTFSNTVSH